ncbi:MAG: OB-fold domain-containing protein [Pseudomonadota bacterium]
MSKYPLTFKDFKQGLIDGNLLGLKCLDCGENMIPPGAVCAACGSSNLEIDSFSKKGTIRTFTVIRVAPLSFRVPYVVALVELADGPWVVGNVDLVGLLAEQAGMELIGKEVSVTHKLIPKDPAEGGVDGFALLFELI